MSITAMKIALEALKYIGYVPREDGSHPIEKAITALRTAISEAEKDAIEFRQFLSDALTAAGLVEHGKQSKGLAERLATGAVRYMAPPQAQAYDQQALELCDKCGWKAVIPGEPCLVCERNATFLAAGAQERKPLSDEEIDAIDQSMCGEREFYMAFARTIEAAHGIKEQS